MITAISLLIAACPGPLARGVDNCTLDACAPSEANGLQYVGLRTIRFGYLRWAEEVSSIAPPAVDLFSGPRERWRGRFDNNAYTTFAELHRDARSAAQRLMDQYRLTAGPCPSGDCWRNLDEVVLPVSGTGLYKAESGIADRLTMWTLGRTPWRVSQEWHCSSSEPGPCIQRIGALEDQFGIACRVEPDDPQVPLLVRHYTDGITLARTTLHFDPNGVLFAVDYFDLAAAGFILRAAPAAADEYAGSILRERLMRELPALEEAAYRRN